MPYCSQCKHYAGYPSEDIASSDDYKGDRCNAPNNMTTVDNYYASALIRYIDYPASKNEDKDCEDFETNE